MAVHQLRDGLWQGVRRAWIRIARLAALAALVGFALSEASASVLNGGHYTAFVHLVSLGIAVIAAYGAAVTVGIFEAVRGIFTALGDAENGLRASIDPAGGWQRPPVVDAETTS